jgi:hypothetical protein
VCDTVEDATKLVAAHAEFVQAMADHTGEFETITRLNEEMAALGNTENPFVCCVRHYTL